MCLFEDRSLLGTISLLIATCLITVVQAGATLDDGLLSFEERVGCQRAIEEVYWRYRIWPAANPGPKPALDEVLPDAMLRKRVATHLQKSAALEVFRQRPLTGEQLQDELNRMARDTRSPDLLRELFAALDDDPFLVAECLARPVLVDRLSRSWYAHGTQGSDRETDDATSDKRPFGEWWKAKGRATVERAGVVEAVMPPVGGYQLRSPADEGCTVDTWKELWYTPKSSYHTAVWTGTEMIVWGGEFDNYFRPESTGGRYDPATDSWTATSKAAGVPDGRVSHSAVWTGTEMIVWGGVKGGVIWSDGGRYNPLTDNWTATDTGPGAPTARYDHTAVWTGTEMIVWGGFGGLWDDDPLSTGARYHPSTNSWTPTWAQVGVPAARSGHTAIWTGTMMIVWGGSDGTQEFVTGGRYDPASDSWTATSALLGVPMSRTGHTAVWTGTEMIVWGGSHDSNGLNSGGRYDPATNSWNATSTTLSVPPWRNDHTAVWTGTEMIIWGGSRDTYEFDTGGRYDPETDTWIRMAPIIGTPEARVGHSAVWTGSEMIVWGGQNGTYTFYDSGARFDPATGGWIATATAGDAGMPTARVDATAVWTGAEMIVWGGWPVQSTAGRYDPATDTWTVTTAITEFVASKEHTAVWTGTEMIIWGGRGGVWTTNRGGSYNPTADSWTATSATGGVPLGRHRHSAVWTGAEMIVWGGIYTSFEEEFALQTGGRYDPGADRWTATSTAGAVPPARGWNSAVWTGTEMIVWGGDADATGGRYHPATDSWIATSTGSGVPTGRFGHTAVWTGTEMIVWGGGAYGGSPFLDSGARYDPASDSWLATSTDFDVPMGRQEHTAVWTGTEMIVWGGIFGSGSFDQLDTGGRYDPGTDSWMTTSRDDGAPFRRSGHTAVWTGTEMIVWGGEGDDVLNSGGRYCACEGGTVSNWYPDADGDGLGAGILAVPACEQPSGYVGASGDCHDRYASCTTDCTDADADGTPACAPDCDDSNAFCTTDCTDADTDTYCVTHDCDDSNPDTHPGAEEINDGLDNNCLYDLGHGLIDEITSVSGFHNPDDLDEFSWTAQAGATSYEVARSPHRRFNTDCLVSEIAATQWIDADAVPAGVCFYYLVRSTQPNLGSWGYSTSGVGRTAICP